ncbi:unnamed protein product [Cyclocybe aegerita]|uniref:DUF8205 domain-containing protein n=1 Tax=Cyclocybe aegerita TaxID=1973307 RepID=A0A8S0XH60_CYCAE|nr:unnamed protein product [Cyclocybe aegerita]
MLKMAQRLKKNAEFMLKLRIAIALSMLDRPGEPSRPQDKLEARIYIYLNPTSRAAFDAIASPDVPINCLAPFRFRGSFQLIMPGHPMDMNSKEHAFKKDHRISEWTKMRTFLDESGNRDAFLAFTHFFYGAVDQSILNGPLPIYPEDIYRARVLQAVKVQYPNIWSNLSNPMIDAINQQIANDKDDLLKLHAEMADVDLHWLRHEINKAAE